MSAIKYNLNTTKKQGVIKVIDLDGGRKAVDYRGTLVVSEVSYNQIKLNTNGWLTNTSKTAINRYFDLRNLPLRVAQEKFTWYVYFEGVKMQYNDNMIITIA